MTSGNLLKRSQLYKEQEAQRQSASLQGGLTFGVSCGASRDPDGEAAPAQFGTSIFDPVLCELVYRWFCPAGGRVLDPFAGGSVRGIVASKLGRPYFGIDLRPEQVEANRSQAKEICGDPAPEWFVGDSRDGPPLVWGDNFDFIFSCPPYGDLEVYSDDPRDISTMPWAAFIKTYREIIAVSAATLKPNRFACFVVSDFRDKATGHYREFPNHTISSFAEAGMGLYNDAVLVTAVGSLPIRTGKQFVASRKLGRTHQNILVFCKGSWKTAAAACDQDCGAV